MKTGLGEGLSSLTSDRGAGAGMSSARAHGHRFPTLEFNVDLRAHGAADRSRNSCPGTDGGSARLDKGSGPGQPSLVPWLCPRLSSSWASCYTRTLEVEC